MSPQPLAHVNPGDRITADFINAVIDEINLLAQQVGTPSPTGTAPIITGLQPSGQVAEGASLDIFGANFAVPATHNIVTLDGVSVTGFLAGSTNTDLKIAVPPIPGVPKQAQLTVETSAGSANTSIQVVAPSGGIPTGQPTVTNVSAPSGTITAGNTYTFSFLVDASGVSMTETYSVQAVYANATPAAVPASAWQSATTLIGVSGTTVTVVPGTPVTVGVQVTVPANATGVALSLALTSLHNNPGSNAASGTIPITVGSAPPQSDMRIKLSLGDIGPAAPFKQGTINGVTGIEVKYPPTNAGRTVQVPITANFDIAGTYQFSVAIANPDTTLWSAGNPSPNPFSYPAGPNAITFPLTLLATGPSNETKTLTVTATLQNNAVIGAISNYTQFPITGYTA